jgi:uncharacterized protein (UPF0332 family)
MAFCDDLLEQAFHLARRERRRPKQVSLRRAISAAYYGLFHFLIEESKINWRGEPGRVMLGRAYEHGVMKIASSRVINQLYRGHKDDVVRNLKLVARTFVTLQEKRHEADYDNEVSWSRTETLGILESVEEAVAALKSIRREPIAQEYLVSLLVKQRN